MSCKNWSQKVSNQAVGQSLSRTDNVPKTLKILRFKNLGIMQKKQDLSKNQVDGANE